MSALRMAALALVLLGGCGGVRKATPSLNGPPPDYAETVRLRLAAAADAESHTLRFNPAACGCPPFEVRLGEAWQRVAFDVSDEQDPVLVALREQTAAAPRREAGRTWEVQGRLDTSLITCGRGALVVTLRPTELLPAKVPADARP
jgi:hypothetical protein